MRSTSSNLNDGNHRNPRLQHQVVGGVTIESVASDRILDQAYKWLCKARLKYSPNSDVWDLRFNWKRMKPLIQGQLLSGTYALSPMIRVEIEGEAKTFWGAADALVLKAIAIVLGEEVSPRLSKHCWHLKGRGLKAAVRETQSKISEYKFVFRSDVHSYYATINHNVLSQLVAEFVSDLIVLDLIRKSMERCETMGGLFWDFKKGIPMGSPLSPWLGAAALIPLDKAMGQVKGIFYARYVDDWVVFTKSKSALRKVVKITHQVVHDLKLQLHPSKTYIGKIARGFNFLAYYMDNEKILPSKETIRRFGDRSAALYESPQTNKNISRRYRKTIAHRDISEYHVNEPAPTDDYFQSIIARLLTLAARSSATLAAMRQYFRKWACWLKLGLSSIEGFETYVQTLLPGISSCWMHGAACFTLGNCR